jgi:hypothetical protein
MRTGGDNGEQRRQLRREGRWGWELISRPADVYSVNATSKGHSMTAAAATRLYEPGTLSQQNKNACLVLVAGSQNSIIQSERLFSTRSTVALPPLLPLFSVWVLGFVAVALLPES